MLEYWMIVKIYQIFCNAKTMYVGILQRQKWYKGNLCIYYEDHLNNILTTWKEPQGQIDLRLVMAFTINESDSNKLELMLADKTVKLKYTFGWLAWAKSHNLFLGLKQVKMPRTGKMEWLLGKIGRLIMVFDKLNIISSIHILMFIT